MNRTRLYGLTNKTKKNKESLMSDDAHLAIVNNPNFALDKDHDIAHLEVAKKS